MEHLGRVFSRAGDFLNCGVDQLQTYGWYLLFGCTMFYCVYLKYLKHRLKAVFEAYDAYKKTREEEYYSAKHHKNPDLFEARTSARRELVEKLQAQYDRQAKEYQKKMQMREEKKRQEASNKLLEGESGRRLGEGTPRSLRPDYNPLMGPGGSTYRRPKRSKCGGGGCGK